MSKQTYLLQNQQNYFLSKHNEWVDGRDLKELFKTPHRDVAMNQLFEVNSQDYEQRIHILECETQHHNLPVINEADLPPPLPKKTEEEKDSTDETVEATNEDLSEVATTENEESVNLQEKELSGKPEEELLVQ